MLPRPVAARAGATAVAVVLGTVGAVGVTTASDAEAAARPKDPRRSQGLFVDRTMLAYQQGGVYRSRLGRVPQSFWVIPEEYAADTVRDDVHEYADDAAAARRTPVLTVYGIPGRDCGEYSSGNPLTTAAEYRAWIRQVAAGLRSQRALVVLEPDAVPLFGGPAGACPTKPPGWHRMLRFASRTLSRAGAWVYLDAGHSSWTPYTRRAAHLKASGIKFARGISTNVSNFRPTRAEKRYAAGLLRGLRRLGVQHLHYVVDTSRNGARPGADGYDVINPTWARVGKRPRLVFRGAFDGTLWVKHPGESDGTEHGGPAAGQWCDLLADRLLGRPESGSC
ncbi:glycoside hydrolase family 6 protein [Nocardioides sp. YIM 152315]|uniref:glycoside hydrolase family 6 protein n=1 Tax=Nocardioides sp. YIM 152315 TaxID=3031760 RepID=UPI0023DA889E|nr:glycoside hydrolase family 6 protein [Nocardioides sp. YIM 152315]MDF1604388.1 glycoside hydrolase family 6 protein [Nocardioides sp. YIM 152315]